MENYQNILNDESFLCLPLENNYQFKHDVPETNSILIFLKDLNLK